MDYTVHGQSMEFSRPEWWSGQPFPSAGDIPNPGIKPRSPALQVDSLPPEPQGKFKNTGVDIPSAADLPDSGIEPRSPALQVVLYQLSYQRSTNSQLNQRKQGVHRPGH